MIYSKTWADFNNALVGIQPQFKQTPPNSDFSTIAVFSPKKKGAKSKAEKLIVEGRANLSAVADYSASGKIDKAVKAIIDKVEAAGRIT